MINLLYEKYPCEVTVEGKSYPVYTDFRDWAAFFDMREDTSFKKEDIILCAFSWFKDDIPNDKNKGFQALMDFAACKDMSCKSYDNKTDKSKVFQKPVISYLYDCEYILGAFHQAYNIDLNSIEYMHWYKFNALIKSLPEDTSLKQRMMYRSVNTAEIKDKAERRRILKIQRQIAIPHKPLDALQVGSIF